MKRALRIILLLWMYFYLINWELVNNFSAGRIDEKVLLGESYEGN